MNFRPYISIAVATLILLVSVGLYAGAYYLLTNASAQATALATQAADKQTELERATEAHIALGSLETDEATLNQYAVAKADVVPFLETLQSTGSPYGASMNVISVSNEKDGKHDRIALSLTIAGSFDVVMRTLGAIEYGPYDSVVRNVILSTDPATATKSGPVWTAAVAYSVGLRAASSSPQRP